MRKWIDIVEGRSKSVEDFKPDNEFLNDIKSKYLPDWEMLDHKDLTAKYVAKDHRHAQEFTKWINDLCEKMDHFALVTQDVSEVTVKTTTFDVKGLTVLDFELAMRVDKYAEENDIEQVRMQGNFGMHKESLVSEDELAEGKKDACYYKIKASAKVWPSAYASGRLVQCRKKGASNYGKGKK